MKNILTRKFSLGFTLILASSCSSNQTVEDRTPASDEGRYQVSSVSLQLQSSTIEYCGRQFDILEVGSSHPGVMIYSKLVKNKNLPFAYPVPAAVSITHPDSATAIAQARAPAIEVVIDRVALQNPIFPSIPILPPNRTQEVCPSLVKYHQQFKNAVQSAAKIKSSKILDLSSGYATLNFNEARAQILAAATQVQKDQQAMRMAISRPPLSAVSSNFLIYYDDEYEGDVMKLYEAHVQLGLRPELIKISTLPGYQPQDPIPAECNGDYFKECFHQFNDPSNGLSPNAVAATRGMVNVLPMNAAYTKLPYIPGLIRASIRSYKKQAPIVGVMLVGNPDRVPGFATIMDGFGIFPIDYDHEDENQFNKLQTDLYYMLPDVALKPTGMFSQDVINPDSWLCQDSAGNRTYRYWCLSSESRAWPTPPLSVLRWPTRAPGSQVMQYFKGSSSAVRLGEEDMKKTALKDLIPVGRIVTHENLTGIHDSIVKDYAAKMIRWNSELPEMTGNSIQSNGGTTNDSWIFLSDDLIQFKATYGSTSSIYASEFFVPLAKCQGSCQYKNGTFIQQQLRAKNRVAFHINGHGGHISVQAPFGNGNVESFYYSDHAWNLDDGQKLQKIQAPMNTVKTLENGGLIGHVIANSCDLTNFNLDSSWYSLMLRQDAGTNVKSLGEQWLAVKNGGAMNVYTNFDVGWSNVDNLYNVKFMKKVKQAHQNCRTIGEALKLSVYDMIQGLGNGADDWQVLNRQFLGSPANAIAAPASNCVGLPMNPSEMSAR